MTFPSPFIDEGGMNIQILRQLFLFTFRLTMKCDRYMSGK